MRPLALVLAPMCIACMITAYALGCFSMNLCMKYVIDFESFETNSVERKLSVRSAASDIPLFELEIHIIVNNRPAALRNLLQSISLPDSWTKVPLIFHLEANQSSEVYDVVRGFQWRNGPVTLQTRLLPGGLIRAVVETWRPLHPSPQSYALLLEDDIVVAPAMAAWLREMLPACSLDSNCAGVSLYTPRVDELRAKKPLVTDFIRALPGNVYAQQLPCSWGATFKSTHWEMFYNWMAARLEGPDKYELQLPLGRIIGWKQSWKKFYAEVMGLSDWYVLYPNFPNQTSLSTNMLEVGEHITKNDPWHTPERYTVPLLTDLPKPKFTGVLLTSDYKRVWDFSESSYALVEHALVETSPTRPRYRNVCEAYNQRLHQELLTELAPRNADGVTLVVSHMYTPGRRKLLTQQLLHYCQMSVVKRILVVWHSQATKAPSAMRCETTRSMIYFTSGFPEDSLLNRFAPTELITTEAVVTMDDDIIVSEKDIRGMHAVWKRNPMRVVGPFAQWYDQRLRYVDEGSEAALDGYPFVGTKLHISHYSLFQDISCGIKYSGMRKFTIRSRNAEDLLYIKVASDRCKCGPALLYRNADTILDHVDEAADLNLRPGYVRQRGVAIRAFKLLDPALWVTTMESENGTTEYKLLPENVMNENVMNA